MRFTTLLLALVFVTTACSSTEEGTAMASPQPPQDVWQLVEQLTALVPLTRDKFGALLGTALTPDDHSPVRFNGGPVDLGPQLKVTSSAVAVIDGRWDFAYVEIEPTPCISTDTVRARYPAAQIVHSPSGHSVYETYDYAVDYDWGQLIFGIREKEKCLTTVSVHRSGAP